jgi:hypothetical protein
MTDDTEAIRARLNAATPGPWVTEMMLGEGNDLLTAIITPLPNLKVVGSALTERDGIFIAHAPADVAYLLAENARLSALIDTAKAWASRHPADGAIGLLARLSTAPEPAERQDDE